MTAMVPLVLWGWLPLCVLLFAVLPPRRAVIVAFIGGYLFLPHGGYSFLGLPDYTRTTATCYGVLLGILIFDPSRFVTFRPRLIDLPMVVLCIAPYFSTVSNHIGGSLGSSLYNGMSMSLDLVFTWGIPYFVGRMYLTDFAALREAAIGIFIGGLLYVPLCLIEIRLSPQLHNWIYGYRVGGVGAFVQTMRLGGYRPMVFLQHGLAVGMYMTAASLVGVWLWVSGSLKRVGTVPMVWLVPILLITTVLCKSTGALVLLIMGLGCLYFTRWTRLRLAVLIIAMIPPLYMLTRITGVVTGERLVQATEYIFDEHRAGSLRVRIDSENLFTQKAMIRPLFGWGGWNRFQVYNSYGKTVTVPDGLWVIILGNYGLVALTSLTAVFLTPAWCLLRRHAPQAWTTTPVTGPAAALTVMVTLYLIDCIPNAMVSTAFILIIGGLTATLSRAKTTVSVPRAAPATTTSPARVHEQRAASAVPQMHATARR